MVQQHASESTREDHVCCFFTPWPKDESVIFKQGECDRFALAPLGL